jgi:hypothetical protein
MKQPFFLLPVAHSLQLAALSIGIGTAIPHASAQLDVSSTGKAGLLPCITTAERTVIASLTKALSGFDKKTGQWIKMVIALKKIIL